MRRYDRFGCRNLRSIGGFPLPEGAMAAEDVFFRSDLPLALTCRDEDFLREKDIHAVLDLRDEAEAMARPDPLRACPLVVWRNLPLGGLIPQAEPAIPDSYLAYARNRAVMAPVLEALAGEGGVLFHCTAGKDRTGVVAALLLWLCGAGAEDIAADYILSGVLLRPVLRDLRAARPDLPAFAGQSKAAYLDAFFTALTGDFPAPADYLAWLGLPVALADRLRAKLTGG